MTTTEAQKKARHTEGPWEIEFTSGNCPGCFVVAKGIPPKKGICYVHGQKEAYNNERNANAMLIASAPELLDALRELLAIGEGGVIQRNETGKPTWSAMDEIKRIAGAAIAKAEGGA